MMVDSSPFLAAAKLSKARKYGKRTLARLLRERGAFSTAHAVDVALDICDALAPVHANGIVHGQLCLDSVRLIYPANAGPSGLEIFALGAELDKESVVAGARKRPDMPFLGPELRGHGRPIDARADVWSLGALLYTMLVGEAPPSAADGQVFAPPNTMPLNLAAVVEACLLADPGARLQTVDQVAEKIASFASSPPERFVALSVRREKREMAERARLRLERSGLDEMPSVLDKLDAAALARANRKSTADVTSVLIDPSTETAIQRLMDAVHAGTDAARLELAAALPALVDFDDDDFDDDDERTRVQPESLRDLPWIEVASAASETIQASLPLPVMSTPRAAPGGLRGVAALLCTALVTSVVAGYAGYTLSAKAAARELTAAMSAKVAAPAAPAATLVVPATSDIPVIAASALPEAVTPSPLKAAKR